LTREPDFDELIGAEATGEERERLRRAHELLVQAGPPPELPPSLQKAPNFGVFSLHQRRVVKRRALVLLAAALSIAVVFFSGYLARGGGNSTAVPTPPRLISLQGTPEAPDARATLAVWQSRNGNWPMRLSVAGLPQVSGRTYYEVYLVRNGKPWAPCGSFRIANASAGAVTLTFNAPYSLQKGDSWIVTRAVFGSEPGKTVLRPVTA